MNLLRASAVAATVFATLCALADDGLTPAGSERGASKDGAIPACEGAPAAAGWSYGKSRRDAFKYKADKPLFTIDASNVDKYAANLSPGAVATLKQVPGFKMD